MRVDEESTTPRTEHTLLGTFPNLTNPERRHGVTHPQ
jgi:hypothetical protein